MPGPARPPEDAAEDADPRPGTARQRNGRADRRDLLAEERDAVADQRDVASHQRDLAADERDAAGHQRDLAADERDAAGGRRDDVAGGLDGAAAARDLVAARRDTAAHHRDLAAERRDAAAQAYEASLADLTVRTPEHDGERQRSVAARGHAATDRHLAELDRQAGGLERDAAGRDRGTSLSRRDQGARERVESADDRTTALSDRDHDARERVEAGLDRSAAAADRKAAAGRSRSASLDRLTGAYVRGAGELELQREVLRSQRGGHPLTVAFADVDGLKAVNDAGGHATGDRLLARVGEALRASLRPYDVVVRYGGDEFVCALAGASAAVAGRRLAGVNTALGRGDEPASVTIGIAELRPDELLSSVVARADAALYAGRHQPPAP